MKGKKNNKIGEHASPPRFHSKLNGSYRDDPSENRFDDVYSTNDVTFPSGRRREATGTIRFAGILGRAARSTGGVFSNFAPSRLFARCLAITQACSPTSDVVTHTDWPGNRSAFESRSG